MSTKRRNDGSDLTGALVIGADGVTYRVSMRGAAQDCWGRANGDDKNEPVEIPRPFSNKRKKYP